MKAGALAELLAANRKLAVSPIYPCVTCGWVGNDKQRQCKPRKLDD